MNTVISRANAIFAFTLSVLTALTFCCFLSTAFHQYKSNIELQTTKASVKSVQDFTTTRGKNDLGFVTFDLKANLTELFNWNVKQLFLYLTAEYETEKNVLNQVVLWDKIIRRGEEAMLDLKSLHTKYYFWDDGHGLRGNKNVTLTLSWNIIPNAGSLPNILGTGAHSFAFPVEYSTARM